MHEALIGVGVIRRTYLKVIDGASHKHRACMAGLDVSEMFVHLFFSSSMIGVMLVRFQCNIGVVPTTFQSGFSMSMELELTVNLYIATLWNDSHSQVFQQPGILCKIPPRSSQGRNALESTLVGFPPLVCFLAREECLPERTS